MNIIIMFQNSVLMDKHNFGLEKLITHENYRLMKVQNMSIMISCLAISFISALSRKIPVSMDGIKKRK